MTAAVYKPLNKERTVRKPVSHIAVQQVHPATMLYYTTYSLMSNSWQNLANNSEFGIAAVITSQ